MALVCHWSLARGTQASISIADTGTQCTLQLTTSTSCQTDDQPSDAEEEHIWRPGAHCTGFVQDSTADSPCEELGQQRCSGGPSDNREVAALETAGRVGDIRPCLQCNAEETSSTGRRGSQALDVACASAGCHKLFSLREKPPAHSQVQMGGKPYTCILCRARSSRQDGLCLDAEAVALVKLDTARKTHTHSSCTKSLTSEQSLYNDQPHTSEACPKGFSQEGSLLIGKRMHQKHCTQGCSTGHGRLVWEHPLRFHARKRTGSAKNKAKRCRCVANSSFYCESCSKHFTTKFSLKHHLMHHNGQRPYSCALCGKRFGSKNYLRKHEKAHSGVGPYVCSICNKILMNKRNWVDHERKHPKHGSHQCNVCKKDFSTVTELANHMEACEKPYSCLLCMKRFSRKDIAVRHEKEHSSDRNYVCGTFGKGFICKHNLSLHEKIHNPEKPYKCRVCQKGFIRKDYLLHHERTCDTVSSAFS